MPDLIGAELENSGECARHLMRILEQAKSGDYRGWRFEITDESGKFVDSMKVEELIGAIH